MRTRTYLAAVLCVGLMTTLACRSETTLPQIPVPTQPAPAAPSPPPTPSPGIRDITVGEIVEESIDEAQPTCRIVNGWPVPCREYRLVAPADGTLVARLSWDPYHNGVLLALRIEETEFRGVAPSWSPIVGRLAVAAGQSYLLAVDLAGQDWFGGDRFVLTTAIE